MSDRHPKNKRPGAGGNGGGGNNRGGGRPGGHRGNGPRTGGGSGSSRPNDNRSGDNRSPDNRAGAPSNPNLDRTGESPISGAGGGRKVIVDVEPVGKAKHRAPSTPPRTDAPSVEVTESTPPPSGRLPGFPQLFPDPVAHEAAKTVSEVLEPSDEHRLEVATPANRPIDIPDDKDSEPDTTREMDPLEVAVTREPGSKPPRIPPAPLSNPEVLAQIKHLEQDIDRELEQRASQPRLDAPMPTPSSALLAEAEGVFATARELLSTDYYLRRWGRIAMRNRSEEVDDFGFDPVYEAKLKYVFDFLYDKYFRVEATGLENIPDQGRCLLIANHSGTLPADGLMIKLAVKREHQQKRQVRWLAEDFLFHFPFLGSISNRIGAVRACQENAERLLRQEALVAVFPEGVKGIGKLYKDRYRLQRFGRGGFIKLALRTRTPIVPVAVVGGEETNPLLYRFEALGKALGFPYVPITPTFPLFGPAGLAPLPTKWRVVFGERVEFSDYDADAADDEMLVSRLSEKVRHSIQELVDTALAARKSIWLG